MATFELMDGYSQNAVIKVVGIGGAGGNAVQHMVKAGVEGVDFICVNTDAQALKRLNAKTTLQIGCNLTKGLGAGANPEVGRQAAVEDRDRIQEVIEGADMLFITAGMGGGTGTGAAPIVAQVAKELGILTVAVVTKPFGFERRARPAQQGVEDLVKYVDSVITIPNDKLLEVLGRQVSFLDAFKAADDVLRGAVQGIADIITKPGLVNVDFADVRAVMSEMGMAMMGTGVATGPERAREAAEMAVNSPLLEDVNVAGARGLLVNITAGGDFTLGELEEVGKAIEEFAADEARVIIGTVIDTDMTQGELRVTVVATGLGRPHARQASMPAAIKVVPASPEAKAAQREGEAERPNYADLDKPTVIRKTAVGQSFKSQPGDEDYLDIPAFLRRQAD